MEAHAGVCLQRRGPAVRVRAFNVLTAAAYKGQRLPFLRIAGERGQPLTLLPTVCVSDALASGDLMHKNVLTLHESPLELS